MATGTKLMKEISDQFLICKICQETFKEPKTLSCLHTFCCACVQQQYDEESNRPTRYTLYTRSVTCPLCRKKTDLPTGGVRRLPDNFLVSNLTEVLAKRCMSKVPPCEICHTVRPRSNDACSKCLDCDKLLCPACVELHSTTKVTQDHSLIDLEGQKDIECKIHPEETVRFYCEKCEECICVVCTFQEHKDHDVCSFNDGFAKHKVTLEALLSKSKARLTDMASRLKVIEKYETLTKELKERIRDLAISYTSQVRAREKELIKQVDELFSGEVVQLAENKNWLQESFDNLQSTCNLTEIVMKDKGVEMLLLKKEIQDKMDHLLNGTLPPEPTDLQHMEVKFVPGEVKLGEVFIPGGIVEEKTQEMKKNVLDKALTNGLSNGEKKSEISLPKVDVGKDDGKPCAECVARKLKIAEEERAKKRTNRDGEKKTSKSVYIQTRPQEPSLSNGDNCNGHFTTTASQVSSKTSVSHNSMQTITTPSRDAGTDSNINSNNYNNKILHVSHQNRNKTCGTMTETQNVRTLKTQTEESCLRDNHLGQAAATGSTYPNTGAAIAAAFLRHKVTDDVYTKSPQQAVQESSPPDRIKDTQDVQVGTDISLGVSGNKAHAIAALCGDTADSAKGGSGADGSKPDLLAETGTATKAPLPSPSSPRIRSRKIQTDISAFAESSEDIAKAEDKPVMDSAMKRSLFAASSSTRLLSTSDSDAGSSLPSRDSRTVSTRDASAMTPFKVKIVQDTVDKGTLSEAIASQSVGLMTSLETRTVYIQTRGPRVTSTATGTDFEGQMSKSTSTLCVNSVDAETAMPQVTYESRTTWTEAVMTSERATCTACSSTSDAATLTSQIQTSDFAVQMRPQGVAACTGTVPPRLVHQKCQTTPIVCHRATMPDPQLLALDKPVNPPPAAVPSQPLPKSSKPVPSAVRPLSMSSIPVAPVAPMVARADKATETVPTRSTTRAVGPNVQMLSSRTASTDTQSLLQATDKETCTPTVKTVDDWTHTPQPQMINTGVTPPRPAVLEVGVATVPITLMDQATYTEVKTMRESGTETSVVVCDSETLTEKTLMCDAQTEVETNTQNQGTAMEVADQTDDSSMTEDMDKKSPVLSKEVKDSGSQCQSPALLNKEVNTTRHRRRMKEVQTCFSYTECLLCQHPEKLEQLSVTKTFTDTSTDPSPPDTHDVATMALSCPLSSPGLVHSEVQTLTTDLYDKGIATSFEFDEESAGKHFLGLESQDAATSTESLPYIGLLSEIDVDELIVIPEANFELVSDSVFDGSPVAMVDSETLTEVLDFAEVGTQTLLHSMGTDSDQTQTLLHHEDDCSKQVFSIGVNTLPKVTFEKETTTPAHHLFSKGTMTFYVTKMDKATSTISYTRPKAESGPGEVCTGVSGRPVKEASKKRKMDDKITMTNRTELRDVAVETDTTVVDGRITQCISKLRNVSERLNSPTTRRHGDSDMLSAQCVTLHKESDSSLTASSTSSQLSNTLQLPVIETTPSQPGQKGSDEQQRHMQFQNLLLETSAVLRPKDPSPVRKAQPITTLKPRTPVTPGDLSGYASKSLPRRFSADRQNKVKMGSQATPPSRLPLLRYNSAPGRIATVPAQTALRKSGATSPRTSPSKIPISQKPAIITCGNVSSDSGPESDTMSTTSSQKVQQRPSLPAITETRTPSSCSDSSFISLDAADSSLSPASAMTSSHSRTPSNVTSVSDTPSDVKHSSETGSVDMEGDGDDTSISSASTALAVTPAQAISSSSESLSKQKKEKKGFMKRLLSGKKKKKESSSEKEVTAKQTAESTKAQKLQVPQQDKVPPPSPKVSKKQQKQEPQAGAKAKQPQKSATPISTPEVTAVKKPSSPVSTPPVSRPCSTDSSGAAAASAAAAQGLPAPPPHHYPPLPDPSKSPPAPKKPRPFVYVRQRIFSIQQDNVEEVQEKKEKEKEEKEEKEEKDQEKDSDSASSDKDG